jgi:hypothetical protein
MKRPAFQFYPADWRKDAALQSCSVSAQGLWINFLCIAHECDPYGHLTVNGKPMSGAQISRLVGLSIKESDKLIAELEDAGVASRTDEGVLFSRRMVKDENLRNVRAAGGEGGREFGVLGAEHGKKGGRPPKVRGVIKPPIEPPPSSSSSSSTSVNTNTQSSQNFGNPALTHGDDEKPSSPAEWIEVFAEQHGVDVDHRNFHDRKKFWPLASAWSNAGVTVGQMRAACSKAHEESKESIAWLPAYVDRVLASMQSEKKPAGNSVHLLSFAERDRIAGMQRWEEQCNEKHPDLPDEYSKFCANGEVIDITPQNVRISQ